MNICSKSLFASVSQTIQSLGDLTRNNRLIASAVLSTCTCVSLRMRILSAREFTCLLTIEKNASHYVTNQLVLQCNVTVTWSLVSFQIGSPFLMLINTHHLPITMNCSHPNCNFCCLSKFFLLISECVIYLFLAVSRCKVPCYFYIIASIFPFITSHITSFRTTPYTT